MTSINWDTPQKTSEFKFLSAPHFAIGFFIVTTELFEKMRIQY